MTSKLPAEAKTYEAALEQFEITMREIGLEHLDLYLVHAPWPWDEMGKDCREENKAIWKAMEEFLAAGRVKAIGVSNFSPDDLASLVPATTVKPMVNQIRWFVGVDTSATVAACAEHDILIEAYSPFAHGLIVNHPELSEIAAAYGVSAPQLCIRYLLAQGRRRPPEGDLRGAHPAELRARLRDLARRHGRARRDEGHRQAQGRTGVPLVLKGLYVMG